MEHEQEVHPLTQANKHSDVGSLGLQQKVRTAVVSALIGVIGLMLGAAVTFMIAEFVRLVPGKIGNFDFVKDTLFTLVPSVLGLAASIGVFYFGRRAR
ncbi:hypothetical protein [Bradyrhizobium algeriense]|uniref:hypothetical protein n=1 Tax=Bradyrhizobium algeriense TaxID=634784 RepID=UPI000D35D43B|nr:hypothetical protein [Bradyrhizobium algeriense]